jgi:spore photoproduct lyase
MEGARAMKPFVPDQAYFEPEALDYPIGKEIYDRLTSLGVDISYTTSHNRITNLPGENELQKYRNAKRTLVVGVRKTLKFDTPNPPQNTRFRLRQVVSDTAITVICKLP